MAPHIIAALITSGTNVAATLFQRWSPKQNSPQENADSQKEEKFVNDNYATYRSLVGNSSFRVLLKMQHGDNMTIPEIRASVYPNYSFESRHDADRFDEEFKYRLDYLEAIGLITKSDEGYYITTAGMFFIASTITRKDYQRERGVFN